MSILRVARREFVAALGSAAAAAWPVVARAQQLAKIHRIGWLVFGSADLGPKIGRAHV